MVIKEILNLASEEHTYCIKIGIAYKIAEVLCSAIPYGVIYAVLHSLLTYTTWDYNYFLLLTGICIIALVGQFIFGVLAASLSFSSGFGMMCDFRMLLLTHLTHLPLGFFQNTRAGSLSSTIVETVKRTEDIFTKILGDLVANITLPLCIGTILLIIDWRMGLAAIISVPLAFLVLKYSQNYFTKLSVSRIDAQSEASGYLLEYIDGIRVIKSFGLAGKKFTTLKTSLKAQRDLSIKLELLGGVGFMLFAIILEFGFIALLVTGAYAILGGQINPSTYLMAMVLSQKFYAPITRVTMLLVDYKYLDIAYAQIKKIMNSPELPETTKSCSIKDNNIVFDAVTFSYDKKESLSTLNAISFELKEGQTTALVGPSGAGKSTIAHLISRFYDIDAGSIKIGGADIQDIPIATLMQHVSMVLQDVYLFNDTIAANIRLGNINATDEDLIEAARNAQCHDFIMALPDKYQSNVGEGGTSLSGGQKQRISIARALLKNSPIILLDESTASIDSENELAFRKAFSALSKGKTVLIIAHRLNTIRSANNILVMDKGKIIQQGTHNELIKQEGLYKELWNATI